MDFKTQYLGKPYIPTWIYRPVGDPNGEFEQKIRAVERALGFDLFVWQKTYIQSGEFRQMGATTAEILRELLDVKSDPLDYSRPAASVRERFYRDELRQVKAKLESEGIPTRIVYFSERDKRAHMPPMFW